MSTAKPIAEFLPGAEVDEKKRKRIRKKKNTNQMIEKIWNVIFQEKVRDFGATWTLTISPTLPPQDQWEEPLQEKLSLTYKCLDCGQQWISDEGLAYVFFRQTQQLIQHPSSNNGVGGEVLICFKGQLCTSCTSARMPAINVSRSEVDAVLSYLQMELGWYYYQRQYTIGQEQDIEKRRIKRKNQAVPKPADEIHKTQQPKAKPVGGSQVVPAGSGADKLTRGSQSTGNGKISDRQTKLKTRWDRPEDKVLEEWKRIFRSKFDKFVTAEHPEDQWVMTLEKVTKSHPLRREKKWTWFLGEKNIEAGFKCSKCDYVWESRRGWVSFWIKQNERSAQGRTGGTVAIHVLGQKCQNPQPSKCPGGVHNKPYETGDLQGEEIELVLSYLLMEIDYWFYDNESYTTRDEEEILRIRNEKKGDEEQRPSFGGRPGMHRRESCQACHNKVCKKKIVSKYPRLPETQALTTPEGGR